MINLSFKPGIRAKLTLIILMVSLLPMVFLGHLAYEYQRKIIAEEVTASHQELSNTLAHSIYENLEFTRRLVSSIGGLEIVRALNKSITEDFFNVLTRNFAFLKLIYLVDSKRNIIASTDPETRLPVDWLYSNAIKRSYQGSLSKVHMGDNNTPFMSLESIIKSPLKNDISGVLISEVNLTSIGEMLRGALKNSRSQGLVLDETGKIIARSSPEVVALSISSAEAIDGDLTKTKIINDQSYLITAVSLKKFDFYQAPNWIIVLQIPEKVAFHAAYRFRDRIIRIISFTILFSLLLAIYLARSFTAPLGNLIDGARLISQGNFNSKINVPGSDEIAELGLTFDEMRINIRKTRADLDYRILQLSTLYEVGKAISSELDFRKLQNMILEIVAKVICADKGSLMLIDESEKLLTIGVAIGISNQIASETRIEIGQSISGWVVKNRKPLFIENVETDELFLSMKKGAIKAGAMMCAPLVAKDKILGALNVSHLRTSGFSQQDFELFISLANQAAIAIDNARLYRYAVTDEMTRLYNHRYFQQRLDEELQRADRYEHHVSLIILDVDHFKTFNDTYGHPEGDRVLKTVAKLVEKNIREIDIPARYGGEEFVVICPEKNGEGSLIPAERIRAAIESFDFRINGKPVPITVSLGAACYPDQAGNKQTLIKRADYALYFSKTSGRNRATLFNRHMERDNQE